ncbi:MAG: zinc-dependent peptidase [Verrucomicrobia bacterium]|nr:zinc-dependent peptidase [Verrucomicrobiota bacterium]
MIIYIIVDKVRRRTHRKRIRRFDFPLKWIKILEQNVPLYMGMPYDLQEHCQNLVMQFIEDKLFEPCGGIEAVTEEMMVTIAGNAVIPILGRPTDVYRSVRTILIYPSTFFQKDKPEMGHRQGEAWASGTVILAWDATRGSARDMRDGKNVAIHEFAHQLDLEDGTANGAPILKNGNQYAVWAEVLGGEFERLVAATAKGQRTVMDDYGATNPAEFFAVASETFFEQARSMQRKHPELYKQLRNYYRIDPARWNRPAKISRKQ